MAWDVGTQNHLESRAGYAPRWLLYVWALETDNTQAHTGMWTGEYDATFDIDGSNRTYRSMNNGMMPDTITYETGTTVRTQRITLNGVDPAALELVMGRIIRGKRAELHLMFVDPVNGTVIGYDRMFKGFVNRAPINIGPRGRSSAISIELASQTRLLTQTLGLKKSHQSHKSLTGDNGRRYSSVASQVKVEWGAS